METPTPPQLLLPTIPTRARTIIRAMVTRAKTITRAVTNISIGTATMLSLRLAITVSIHHGSIQVKVANIRHRSIRHQQLPTLLPAIHHQQLLTLLPATTAVVAVMEAIVV